MAKGIPHVDRYMTPSPYSVGQEQKLLQAHRLMREHHIRHLPVLHGGKLVGVISDRDLHLIETLRDVDPEKVLIEEAMSPSVYTVSPKAPLDEVVREMVQHRYGCAVVVEGGKVVGVFTTVDALRAFADTLEARSAKRAA
jgi:acetoin utilization protein AcuB